MTGPEKPKVSTDALQSGGSGVVKGGGLSGGGSGSGTHVGKTTSKAHGSKTNSTQGSGLRFQQLIYI